MKPPPFTDIEPRASQKNKDEKADKTKTTQETEANETTFRITDERCLNSARQWVLLQSADYSAEALNVIATQSKWLLYEKNLQQVLLEGNYHFSAPNIVTTNDQQNLCWSLSDSLVLRAIAIVLKRYLKTSLSPVCFNTVVTDREEAIGRIMRLTHHYIEEHPKSYVVITQLRHHCFTSQHSDALIKLLNKLLPQETAILKLIEDYFQHINALHFDPINADSLMPFMNALLLNPLDEKIRQLNVFYARFMNDWIVIIPKRKDLNTITHATQACLKQLQLKACVNTLLTGKASWGFDFMGQIMVPNDGQKSQSLGGRLSTSLIRFYERSAQSRFKNIWNILFVIILVSMGFLAGDALVGTLDEATNFSGRLERLINPNHW